MRDGGNSPAMETGPRSEHALAAPVEPCARLDGGRDDITARLEALERSVRHLEDERARDGGHVCISIRSGTYDGFLYGLAFASAAAASGIRTSVFVAQWGLAALRDPTRARRKPFLHRLFAVVLPSRSVRLPLAQAHFSGLGNPLLRRALARAGGMNVEEYLEACIELGVEFMVCPTSVVTLGLGPEDFDPRLGVRTCGIVEYLEMMTAATVTMEVS